MLRPFILFTFDKNWPRQENQATNRWHMLYCEFSCNTDFKRSEKDSVLIQKAHSMANEK